MTRANIVELLVTVMRHLDLEDATWARAENDLSIVQKAEPEDYQAVIEMLEELALRLRKDEGK